MNKLLRAATILVSILVLLLGVGFAAADGPVELPIVDLALGTLLQWRGDGATRKILKAL